jgi:Rod binding domain-containing protein
MGGFYTALSEPILDVHRAAGIAAAVGAGAGLAVGVVNQMKKKRAQSKHETVTVDDFKEGA